MMRVSFRVGLTLLVCAAAPAWGQAPGQTPPFADTDEPPAPTPPSEVVNPFPEQAPAAPAAPPPPNRRISVALSAAKLGLTSYPEMNYETGMSFDSAQLAVRYRPWEHLELEGAYLGGHSNRADGGEGEFAIESYGVTARYRFNPHDDWNWWLLGGVGTTRIERRDATDTEIELAARTHGAIGVGLERRWDRFALHVELRAMLLGLTATEMELDANGTYREELSGGTAALGAGYYF